MTSTRAINAAAAVIHACIQQGKPLPATQAYALDSAGLLNSPEHAAEVEQLRALVADWEGTRRALALILKHGDMSDTVRQEIAQLISDEPDVDGAGRTYESYYPAAERPVDEDPIAYSLTPAVEALHASSGAVIETPSRREQSTAKLRGIFARQQAAVEEAHETPPRPTPHDLPEVTP